MWDNDSAERLPYGEFAVAGLLAVCSDPCEKWLRDNAEDVMNWGVMALPEFIGRLSAATLNLEAVKELFEVAALGNYVQATQMPGHDQEASECP